MSWGVLGECALCDADPPCLVHLSASRASLLEARQSYKFAWLGALILCPAFRGAAGSGRSDSLYHRRKPTVLAASHRQWQLQQLAASHTPAGSSR